MPGLFALAQHPALHTVHTQLGPDEAVFAFLDDIYILSTPERTRTIFDAVQRALWDHARIAVNLGKTKVWNAGRGAAKNGGTTDGGGEAGRLTMER